MMAIAQTVMIGGPPYTALSDAIFTRQAAKGIVVLFSSPLTERLSKTMVATSPGNLLSQAHRASSRVTATFASCVGIYHLVRP